MTLPDLSRLELVEMPEIQLDRLVGCFFWWDGAPTAKRRIYHGRIVASLEGGYYLLKFDSSEHLPDGVHEIVHVSTMTEHSWSFFQTETDYLAALVPDAT